MKHIRRVLSIALSLMFVLTYAALPAYAGTSLSAITNESIKEKQGQISDSEKMKKDLESNITNAKTLKKELEALKSDTKK